MKVISKRKFTEYADGPSSMLEPMAHSTSAWGFFLQWKSIDLLVCSQVLLITNSTVAAPFNWQLERRRKKVVMTVHLSRNMQRKMMNNLNEWMLLFGMKDDRLHSSLVYINCQIRGHLFRSHLTALQNHRKYCEYRTHSTPINITMCLQNRSLSFSTENCFQSGK